MSRAPEITDLLARYQNGDEDARERLAEIIYPQLKSIAGKRLGAGERHVTLQTTELVNETYLLLLGQQKIDWRNRAHFFAIAARLMRQALVDSVRHRGRAKRGDGRAPLPLDAITLAVDGIDLEAMTLEQAIQRLAKIDERAARVVELRFFSGMSLDEVAEALDIGRATAHRSWRFAKSWLHFHLASGSSPRLPPDSSGEARDE